MSDRQQKNYDDFTAALPSDSIWKWEKMVEDWNANQKAPNPYIEPVPGKPCLYYSYYTVCSFIDTSFTSLRLELAKEEAASIETGLEQPHEMTPSQLIQKGLDLEEQQFVKVVMCILVH
jgi:hypothetical protein